MRPTPGENEIIRLTTAGLKATGERGVHVSLVQGSASLVCGLWMLLLFLTCCGSESSRRAPLPRLRRQAKWRISFGGAVCLSGVADCPTLDSKGEIGGPTSAYSLHITPAHLAH